MMGALRAIPMPLRIAVMILLVLVLYTLVGQVPLTLFILLAVVFWALALGTWAYDQGWLNPLARVPALSRMLGWMANRAALTGGARPATGAKANDAAPQATPGELDDAERQALLASARRTLAALKGNDHARDLIEQRIVGPAADSPENPFGSNAPGMIVLIAGPRGVGKTSLARAVSNMLVGVGAIRTAKIVTVRDTDLRTGEFRSAIELARSKAKSARGGTLLLDDADWLLEPDPYGGGASQGGDFGMTLVEALADAPRETLVVATLSHETVGRLREDPVHGRWLGKLVRRDVPLDDLEDDDLVEVLEGELQGMGWELADDSARTRARRAMGTMRDRMARFDNAIACRRAAETLIDVVTEDFEEMARQRRIGRDAVDSAEDELE